ncbi:TPA: hypothetical protein I9089_002340 [Clostridium perfringens]|nr:hypothetical protein [Clostridium perfringens]
MNKFNSKETTLALKEVLSKIQQNYAREYKNLGLYIRNKDGGFKSLKEMLEDIN